VDEVVNNGGKVHAYLGGTYWGPTRLFLVNDSSNLKNTFRTAAGRNYTGVCAEEYQQFVLFCLCADAQKRFTPHRAYKRIWVWQQDGASIHRAKETEHWIKHYAPGGLLEGWPANSPDLNWIENMWSWMERELRKRPQCNNDDELVHALEDIWKDMNSNHLDMFKHCVDSLPLIMQQVIDNQGGYTGH
jgi:hypothetical protein